MGRLLAKNQKKTLRLSFEDEKPQSFVKCGQKTTIFFWRP
jgi:hypothetical protein